MLIKLYHIFDYFFHEDVVSSLHVMKIIGIFDKLCSEIVGC